MKHRYCQSSIWQSGVVALFASIVLISLSPIRLLSKTFISTLLFTIQNTYLIILINLYQALNSAGAITMGFGKGLRNMAVRILACCDEEEQPAPRMKIVRQVHILQHDHSTDM